MVKDLCFVPLPFFVSPSITVRGSMNLHSGCSRAVEFPSGMGQVIYKLLVCFLMGSRTDVLNSCHIANIYHPLFFYAKVVCHGMIPYV